MLTPELVDRWRVIPRVLVAAYGFTCYQAGDWFMSLPDPSMAQTTFVSTVYGASALWFNFYVNSGPAVRSSDVRTK